MYFALSLTKIHSSSQKRSLINKVDVGIGRRRQVKYTMIFASEAESETIFGIAHIRLFKNENASPPNEMHAENNLASFRFHFRGCLLISSVDVFTFHTCRHGMSKKNSKREENSVLALESWMQLQNIFGSANLSPHYRSHHALVGV